MENAALRAQNAAWPVEHYTNLRPRLQPVPLWLKQVIAEPRRMAGYPKNTLRGYRAQIAQPVIYLSAEMTTKCTASAAGIASPPAQVARSPSTTCKEAIMADKPTTAEISEFLESLRAYRATITERQQEMLDFMVVNTLNKKAEAEKEEVQSYWYGYGGYGGYGAGYGVGVPGGYGW